MYSYELSMQIEGIRGHRTPNRLGKVFFQNIEGKLHASTIIASGYKATVSERNFLEATDLLHKAVSKLNFIYKRKIVLSKDGYIMKRLFDHKFPWITTSTVTHSYSMGVDHDKLAESINLLQPKMVTVLNKVLGYYEAAMESTNPYVKILLLVSCVEAMIKGRYNIKGELRANDLNTYLDEIRKSKGITKRRFRQLVSKRIYGKRRSSTAHGSIDINSNYMVNIVQEEYQKFLQIVDAYIEDFLDKYKSPVV